MRLSEQTLNPDAVPHRFPTFSFFGTTTILAAALHHAALPMTIHVSEMVFNRAKVGRQTMEPVGLQ
jgi:hypothetical protein